MYKTVRHIVVELACQLPDWIFLTAGVLILGAAWLVPQYLEDRQLAWQRDLQKAQVQRLAEQYQDQGDMLRAFDAHDPVLLGRTSYYYLHLKPSGTTPIVPVGASTIDQWLHRPMPRPGVDFPAYSPLESWVTAITTGPMRIPAVAAGAMCIFLGLIPIGGRRTLKFGRAPAPAPGLSTAATTAGSADSPFACVAPQGEAEVEATPEAGAANCATAVLDESAPVSAAANPEQHSSDITTSNAASSCASPVALPTVQTRLSFGPPPELSATIDGALDEESGTEDAGPSELSK